MFSDYHLRVGEVTANSHPPEGHRVLEQRFDATEIGRSKVCLLVEVTPEYGRRLPNGSDDLTRSLGLAPEDRGLVSSDVFDSIYSPGKVMALLSWDCPETAGAFTPTAPAEAVGIRTRTVRVIRD